MNDTPKVTNMQRHAGIAGQYEITATVQYDDEPASVARFVGSTYGGPVVMVMPSGAQTFVTDPDRFGAFGIDWVRRFFA